MKGDFTRLTFKREKHYSSIRMQQGRVQLDADWNEQVDIARYRMETETTDTIGACGAPLHDAGFALTDGASPKLAKGHYYVDGILCENDSEIALNKQPDFPSFTLPTASGTYIAYLDVWERHITALEDDGIREVALGGPDTATRTKTIWQVKLLGPLTGSLNCSSDPEAWKNAIAPSTGQLKARSQEGALPSDECDVPSGGGYRRLENQLYRVEIHTSGNRGTAKFKWSRENGSVATRWLEQNGNDLIVSSTGRDKVLGFASGQTVELIDRTMELDGEAGVLVKLSNAEGQVLTMDSTDPAAATVNRANFDADAKVRRWESDGLVTTGSGWIALEDGVEVSFAAGFYQVGDYWLIPARTARGDVEWPDDGGDPPQPIFQEQHGIRHHYCRLAIVERAAAGFTVIDDCRNLFPPLTELTAFYYVGGDGQMIMPGEALPRSLRVVVMNGEHPVQGARVTFEAQDSAGRVAVDHASLSGSTTNTITVQTGANGVASCVWRPVSDVSKPSQLLSATLLDSAGNATDHPAIHFNAQLNIASQVYYDPSDCAPLDSDVTTVQDAIDALCALDRGGGSCCVTIGQGGQFPDIASALEKLKDQKVVQICICLLPGEHPESDGLSFIVGPDDPHTHITIRGCDGIRLKLTKPWIFEGLGSLTLEDVEIVVPDMADLAGYLRFTKCQVVSLESCVLGGRGNGSLIALNSVKRLTIANNLIVAMPKNEDIIGRDALEGTAAAPLFVDPSIRNMDFTTMAAADSFSTMPVGDRRVIADRIETTLVDNAAMLTEAETTSFMALADGLRLPRAEITPEVLADRLDDILVVTASKQTGAAILLADSATIATINDNYIRGTLALYGLPPTPDTLSDEFTGTLSKFLEQLQEGTVSFADRRGSIEMRGNTFTQVLIAQKMIEQIEAAGEGEQGISLQVFQTILLADNIFEGNFSMVAAGHLSVLASHFRARKSALPGIVLGDTAVYVANRGPSKNARLIDTTLESEQTANVRLTIAAP